MSASDGGGSSPARARVKEERECAGAGDLYAEHEVKHELVLGPERLQPQDVAYALRTEHGVPPGIHETVDDTKLGVVVKVEVCAGAAPGRPGGSCAADALRPCTVELERVPVEELLHARTACRKTFLQGPGVDTHVCDKSNSETLLKRDKMCANTKFICDNCGKEFSSKRSLVRYLQIDVDEPRVCDICEKLFLNVCSLLTHKRVHFTCNICLRVFKKLGYLANHKAIHLRKIIHKTARVNAQSNFKRRKNIHFEEDYSKSRGTHNGNKSHSSEICHKHYVKKSCLEKHQLIHSEESQNSKNACQKQSYATNYMPAMEKADSYLSDASGEVSSDQNSLIGHLVTRTRHRPHTCDICNKTFRFPSLLKRHKLIHSEAKHRVCGVCKKTFKRLDYMTWHMRVHTGELRCYICNKAFSTRGHLARHILVHTGDKPHSCDICNKQFRQRSHLVAHGIKYHSEPDLKPHACDICNKTFRYSSLLKKHKPTHSTKSHVCDICKKAFKHLIGLIAHKRFHTGKNLFSCDICKKGFFTRAYIADHMLIHSGAKPHSCDICNKQFRHRSSMLRHKKMLHFQPVRAGLKKHKFTHSGTKNHVCDICKKAFKHLNSLTAHKCVQPGEKLFSCDICKKGFSTRASIAYHMLIHSGAKPHSCEICNKQFRKRSHLVGHKLTHSQGINS